MAAEIDPQLAALLDHTTDEEWLDVILELSPAPSESGGSRSEAIARRQAGFQAIAAQVKSAVQDSGGTIEGEAWINSTLKCRVPARAVKTLGERRDIMRIDVPHRLSRD